MDFFLHQSVLNRARYFNTMRLCRISIQLGGVCRRRLVEKRTADLRAFAVGVLERHLERRIRSAAMVLS